jgi:hypothetical protein
MKANRYLNVVLTVIAIELGWMALASIGVPLSAQQVPMPVVITGVNIDRNVVDRNQTLPVSLREITATTALKVEADRPLRIQEPLTVRIPVTTSPRPGL